MTSDYLFDTSAIGKHYHPEVGSAKVDTLLATGGVLQFVSRQTVVEFHSAMAKKVRTGHLTPARFHDLTRRFRGDISARRLRVVRLLVSHFRTAERLVRRLALTQNLRTLDAIQLAVALGLNDPARPITFVCADQALCTTATAEGLTVVNPELP
ncbi:MAG: type II toxin-antitoxin system VapC family toxin [Gemmataceae bacterium]